MAYKNLTPVIFPTLVAGIPIVDPATGMPTVAYLDYTNKMSKALTDSQFNQVGVINDLTSTIESLGIVIRSVAENKVITEQLAKQTRLSGSYTDPSPDQLYTVNTPADADEKITLNIKAHTRRYSGTPATSVTVNAGTITNLDQGVGYVIYYLDPTLSGGDVTYLASQDANMANQAEGRHFISYYTTPKFGTTPTPGGSGGGGVGGGGRCIWTESYLPQGFRAERAVVGHKLMVLNDDGDDHYEGEILRLDRDYQPCVTIETVTGIKLTMSHSTPVPVKNGQLINAPDLLGHLVCVMDGEHLRWEIVVDVQERGDLPVVVIDGGGVVFAAGDQPGRMIFNHNKPVQEERVNEQ